MAGVRMRADNADYLMIGSTYEFIGNGFTKLDDDPAASTSSKRYINMRSEVQSITGYAWTAPFTFDQIDSEKAIASQVNEAFSNYGINVVPWSEKEKFVEKLAS